jgi:endonuclease/exonuclease/phosphatase family metal-dependent hydrolase
MKVLTYNIAGYRGSRNPRHLQEVAELIVQTEPEVVGLQEVVHRSGAQNPEEQLAEWTGMHAAFVPAHHFRRYCLGNAILCRDPIHETVTHDLPFSWPERRILLEVRTTAAGLPLTVFCTHLVHLARMARRIRLAQVTAIAKLMGECWRPHLLLGDLNACPRSRELAPVREHAGGHDHLSGLSTWPARRPWVLYDHIWPGPGWDVRETRVLDLHVSDHRPLLARLGWKGAPRYHIPPDEEYALAATGPTSL